MLQIVTGKAPILSKVCRPFVFADPEIDPVEFARDLGETMKRKNGLGLAAPQVGVDLRIFVMKSGGGWMACFNPIVLRAEGNQTATEGCLSFPGLQVPVHRHRTIRASWVTEEGHAMLTDLTGLPARIYLHELDHLNGKTIQAKLSPIHLALAAKKAAQAQQRAGIPR